MEERNALVFSQRSEWITTLYASFQDDENLYLVMEYVSGASFRALLNNRETIMGETEARFYIAEMVLALAEVHNQGYIHRDVKPENYLLDATGHIKLADFGSCIRYTKGKMISSQIAVGTPDYISPEILRANEGKAEYGVEVDWWSLGIILYELLCDEVPFYAESLVGTYGKIMNHETTFAFPNEPELTENCQDLIKRLICRREERLGRLDAEEIKNHKWFDGIDWANIRKSNRRASHIVATAPFIPELSGPEDTRYFEDEENETKKFVKKALVKTKEFSGNSLAFVGYNYVHNSTAFIQYPGMTAVDASASASTSRRSATASPAEVQELKDQLAKNAEVTRHLQATLAALELQKAELENEGKSAKLAHEMSISKNRDLESKLSNVETLYASATSNGNLVQELTEIKTQLESDIAKLNADIRCQKEDAIKVQHSLAENIKSKTVLETKIKDQQDQISALQQEREALKTTIAVTTDSSLQRSQEFAEVTAKLAKLTLDYEASVVQNQAKTSLIQEKTKQLEEHAEAIAQLEKTEAIHKLEIAAAASKYSEAELEVARLNQEIQELNKNAQSTSNSELESLKTQLQSQQAARAKTVEELASIQKSKALLEIEVSSLNKSRIISQQAQQELAEQILELDKKVKEQEL
ncbi:Serine/threonine-protein kinase MRCK alpha, partial [Kappamyces sp. JEL0680]